MYQPTERLELDFLDASVSLESVCREFSFITDLEHFSISQEALEVSMEENVYGGRPNAAGLVVSGAVNYAKRMERKAFQKAGEVAGKAVGDAVGYARGYSEGKTVCKAEGSGGGGQMTDGTIRDKEGRTIYPVVVTFTERHKNGNQIVSYGVVFSYSKNISVTSNIINDGKPKSFVDLGTSIVGGGVEYTYKSAEATSVSASINTRA